MTNSGEKITRQQFINSYFLKINVTDFQKNYLHHNRFVLQVITDRSKQISKRKYSQIKRFSDQLYQKLGMKQFSIDHHLRNSKRQQEVNNLFKKINSGYLVVKESSSENQIQIKNQLRNYLFNLLFGSIQQIASSDQDEQGNASSFVNNQNSPSRQKRQKAQQQKPKQRHRETTFPNVIRNIFKKKDQDLSEKDLLLKNLKNIWIKSQKGWLQKRITIIDDNLIISQKIDQAFKHIVPLKYLHPQFIQGDYYFIKLSHTLLESDIRIRLNSIRDILKDDKQEYVNLNNALRDICDKNTNIAYNFIGVFINNKKNKFMIEPEKRPAQRLNIKLTHQNEICSFTMPFDSGVYLQLPILNNYGKYECQILEQKQAGLIPNLRQNSIIFTLPVQNMYDQLFNQKPKRKTPQMKSHMLQSKQCNYSIRMEYFQLTTWKSYFSGSINDRFEGLDKNTEFSRDQFRIQKNRIKRIIFSIQRWFSHIKRLKNWQNHSQSIVFYLTIFFSIIFFDANYILQYLLVIICFFMACLHPTSYSYFRDFMNLVASPAVVQKIQHDYHLRQWHYKFKIISKKNEEKRKFLQQFSMRKKKKRNILEKYNRLQEILLRGQLYLTQFVTISQKIKNIFGWYHHQKTKWLFLLSLTLFFALFFIPIRMIALLALAKMCISGKNYRFRTKQLNKLIVFELFRIFIEEENLNSIRQYLQNPLKSIDRRSGQFHTFEKKSKQNISQILQIDFDPALFAQANCMHQIIQWLSQYPQRFIISQYASRKYKLNLQWSTNRSSLGKFLLAIYLFIINIPSDRNILDVKPEIIDPELKQDDSDQDQM